jgi:hypothetical protein
MRSRILTAFTKAALYNLQHREQEGADSFQWRWETELGEAKAGPVRPQRQKLLVSSASDA